MSLLRRITTPALVCRVLRQDISKKSIHCCVYKNVNITPRLVNVYPNNTNFNAIRWKSKKVCICF